MGKHLLLWSKEWFEAAGFTVLYGDTDSLFVRSAASDPDAARARGRASSPPRSIAISSRYIEDALAGAQPPRARVREAVPEAVPAARPSQHARREQALCGSDLLGAAAPGRSSSSAWRSCAATATLLAKRVQRELYERLFSESAGGCLPRRDRRPQVRRGELDEELVYHKNLRKGPGEYTATTPPHVAAARKSSSAAGPSHPLRHDHGGRRAARQSVAIRSTASTMSRSRSSRSRSPCWTRSDWTSSA